MWSIWMRSRSKQQAQVSTFYLHGLIWSRIQTWGLCVTHVLINYIDIKAKCRHLEKFTSKGTLRQVFICLRPPPLFCLGWSSNFVYSKYRVINSCRICSPTGLNTPPPSPSHILSVCTVLWHREGGGESWTREKVRGATVHNAEAKIPTCKWTHLFRSEYVHTFKHSPNCQIAYWFKTRIQV